MSDAVEVELSALTGGCSELQGIRGGFGDILEAANVSNGLAPLSFGILCSFFTPPAQLVQAIEIAALNVLAQGIEKTAQAVQECHTDYVKVDDDAARRYSKLAQNDAGQSWQGLPGGTVSV